MNDQELRELLDREGRAAEEAEKYIDDGAPIPSHVTVSRPGNARSKVLQVRLNPDEFDKLQDIATARELPISTIARAHLLGLIQQSEGNNG